MIFNSKDWLLILKNFFHPKRPESASDFNYDRVNKASKACGPLVIWAKAQLNYADVLEQAKQLRNGLKNLEEQAAENFSLSQEEYKRMIELEADVCEIQVQLAKMKDRIAENSLQFFFTIPRLLCINLLLLKLIFHEQGVALIIAASDLIFEWIFFICMNKFNYLWS